MHSFRLRYVVLGLLIYLQNAFCRTCGSKFDDISSKTLLADVVFEGNVLERVLSLDPYEVEYNVIFQVNKVFKGDLPRLRRKDYHPITAGIFGFEPPDTCERETTVDMDVDYIVFLNTSSSSLNTSNVINTTSLLYVISSLPELSTKKTRRDVRNILCSEPECETRAKAPRGRLSPRGDVKIREGKKLQLRCKGTGNPTPVITWRKNGVPLEQSKKVRFRNSKSTSRLRIKAAQLQDTGQYTCHIENVLGEVTRDSHVTVESEYWIFDGRNYIEISSYSSEEDPSAVTPQAPAHAIPCKQQTFCLNGGTCYKFKNTDLNEKFCKCTPGFIGARCETKDIQIDFFGELKRRDDNQFDRAMVILGFVIAVVVILAMCVVAYCMAKKKKKEFRLKQAAKRQAQKATYSNGLQRSSALEEPEDSGAQGGRGGARGGGGVEMTSLFSAPKATSSTQTEAQWYDHMSPSLHQVPPPSYNNMPPTHHHHYNNNNPHSNHHHPPGGSGSPTQAYSAPELLDGRPRLHAISATPELSPNFHGIPNSTVVSAVVETEPENIEATEIRSSPNQSLNSRTESEHGIPTPNGNPAVKDTENRRNSHDNNCFVKCQPINPSSAVMLNHCIPSPPPHSANNNPAATILDFDQQSDYDNQPASDLEVNVASEADTQELEDDLESSIGQHNNNNKGQTADMDDEVDNRVNEDDIGSDSDSSTNEEQALFHKLKSSRQNSRQGSVGSDLNLGDYASLFGTSPFANSYSQQQQPYTSTSPQPAFNPYAADDDSSYFGNFGTPSLKRSHPEANHHQGNHVKGRDLIMQNPLLYDPDPDATPL